MEMVMRNQDHMFTLYKEGDKLLLEVVCGGIALYPIKIVLNESERTSYFEQGDEFLIRLARRINKEHVLPAWQERLC
jgi:hypothetical protein